jgi:hypothetical protein
VMLLLNYPNLLDDFLPPTKDLLGEFLNRDEKVPIGLNLEHDAEIVMVKRLKEMASSIMTQNREALTVIRSFLTDYKPTDHANRDIQTSAKGEILEILADHLITPKLLRANACTARRILFVNENRVTTESLEAFLKEPEVLSFMKVKKRPLRKRARSQLSSSINGLIRTASLGTFGCNSQKEEEREAFTEYMERQDSGVAFSCPSLERVATMSLGTLPMDTDEDG